jgi:mannose-6-phosphate isomerase
MSPVLLAPNLIDHFYAGGAKIAALRGLVTTSANQPEEWIAATVTRLGEWPVGLARSADGALLRDLVAADPVGWVGADVEDGDTGVLLKLLDAGQRLPVHVHPDRAFAAAHLDCPYGKTESWLVLDATGDRAVYLGWSDDIDPTELEKRRDAQDGAWMLDHLNRIEVSPGDGIVVPAGTAHAIGSGVFVAEVQEPTDFSILLEWSVTASGRDDSHLGLGFGTVMPAVSHERMDRDRLATLRSRVDLAARTDALVSCLSPAADPFFRLDVAAPAAGAVTVPAGFAALVVLGGSGVLTWGDEGVDLHGGETLAVPAALGPWAVSGDASVLVARPAAGWPGGVS